ncbi:uncharacterized protein LOC116416360 [Nasonia vitripennis]|uniref:Uncharacterized protein n=1 Tax=Nasonia vitripennis TaxID=7425 RepID=A0A7M7Q201_NASVI|nr:uncharacterized protein LOC116416360 [Nasonia vitripennis]
MGALCGGLPEAGGKERKVHRIYAPGFCGRRWKYHRQQSAHKSIKKNPPSRPRDVSVSTLSASTPERLSRDYAASRKPSTSDEATDEPLDLSVAKRDSETLTRKTAQEPLADIERSFLGIQRSGSHNVPDKALEFWQTLSAWWQNL